MMKNITRLDLSRTRSFASCGLILALLALAEPSHAVGTRRFELQRGKDFQGGDLKGVAIDSAGRVHAGLNLGAVPLGDAQSVWSALPRPDGSLLLGTGNEGKLLELRGTTVKVLAETKALVVTSLVQGWNGDVFLGTLPSGEVQRWSGGKLSTLVKLPGAEHVWALAFDDTAQALYAATGPEGKLFRIDKAGRAQVYFDAEEQHLMSLALSPRRNGNVVAYAGASDKAKLYEIRAPGRASVLYDFGRTEVRAIVVNPRGEIFAIANDIKGGSVPSRDDDGGDSGPSSPQKTTGKGVLYRFSSDGSPEQLLEDSDEHFTSLALGTNGQPFVGTGVNGRIYTVDESHNDVLMADTEERQATVLSIAGKQQFVSTSDPAVLHPLRGVGGTDAVWTSKPLDAGLRAHFGVLSWTASGAIELSTRSGNTQQPDDTWSAWSEGSTQPGMTKSPPARYIQIRARWNKDPQAALSDVTRPFVTDNLRAVITSVEVDRDKDDSVADGSDIGSSGGPVNDDADPVIKLKWKVENPDSDELRYRLQYRLIGTNEWLDILKPGRLLTKNQFDWDTSDLPEGHYRLRVQVSDELSNPPDRVKKHELSSSTIIVDNTPPALVSLEARERRVTGTAVDGVGPIARIEMGVAGSGEWYPFYPRDGIYDQERENFDVDVSGFAPAGRVIVSVRVYDRANNFVVRHVTLP
jgi:hypothetical protein